MIDLKALMAKPMIPSSKDFWELVIPFCQTDEFPKGHFLLKEGQICHRLYYIETGTARTFYEYAGKDITSWIYPEQQSLTAWYSFLSRQASFEHIEILEKATIYSISYDALQALYKKDATIANAGRIIVERQVAFLDAYSKGYLFMTAKERYELLLSFFPDVTQRVNLGHIASLLGITQETLSRIRRQR